MTDTFVPLLPNVAASAETKAPSYRMKIMPPTVSEPFKPVEVKPAPVPAASATHQCAQPGNPGAQPVITLQHEGEKVTHIRIQCGCGLVIELQCGY
jgi:hypothetical protein